MTIEEMNKAAARAVGWRFYPGKSEGYAGPPDDPYTLFPYPDFCGSLDACRELIAALTPDQRHEFCSLLPVWSMIVTDEIEGSDEWTEDYDTWQVIWACMTLEPVEIVKAALSAVSGRVE